MRLAFDMQAFQSVNAIGGIGTYNRSFLARLLERYPDETYALFYNGRSQERLQGVAVPSKVRAHVLRYFAGNDLNPINRLIQRVAYSWNRVDIIHVLSPFEPQTHTVIARRLPAKLVVTVYDFIPLLYRNKYLPSRRLLRQYAARLKLVQSAHMALAISEATRSDAIELLDLRPEQIVNIGLAPSESFARVDVADEGLLDALRTRHEIAGPFILTVSNLDHRKNLPRLLRAYAALPRHLRQSYSLVVVCNSSPEVVRSSQEIQEVVRNADLRIRFLYRVPTADLVALYNCCTLFVYASLYEGGGLPVLEAMRCGAPVIASNSSSIPEYIASADMLFNPNREDDIAAALERFLDNEELRLEIARQGEEFAKGFTWDRVVDRAIAAYKSLC